MTEGHFDYAKTYAAMPDQELLALARDPGALTCAAQAALREEVNKRGLGSDLDQKSEFLADRQRASGDSRITQQFRRWVMYLARQLDPLESPQSRVAEGEQGLSDIEPEEESPSSPQPVRGWLLILISYMICVPVLETFEMARQTCNLSQSTLEMFTGLGMIFVAWIITAIPALMFMVYAGVGLLGKWRHGVKIAKISLVIEIIVSFFFSAAFGLYRAIRDVTIMGRTAHVSVFGPATRHNLAAIVLVAFRIILSTLHAFRDALPSLVALLYLQKSRRVRLTYPRD